LHKPISVNCNFAAPCKSRWVCVARTIKVRKNRTDWRTEDGH